MFKELTKAVNTMMLLNSFLGGTSSKPDFCKKFCIWTVFTYIAHTTHAVRAKK